MRRTRAPGALGAALLCCGLLISSATSAGAQAGGPILWGATVHNIAKQTPLAAVQAFQGEVGRTLGATRDFLWWDSAFPTAYELGLQAQGTTIVLSVATRLTNGTPIPWATIAAAQPGSSLYEQMQSWADRIRDFGSPIWVTLQHEPEAAINDSLGAPTDYIAAWQNWVSVFTAEGATNVRFMFITTAFGYTVKPTSRQYAPAYYPGDNVVQGIGVDAYNWYDCPNHAALPWNSLQYLIRGQLAFASAHPTEQLWVTEFASVENPADPTARAQWISDAQTLFETPPYSAYAGVMYYDLNKSCDWQLETSPEALTAFATMGADPYYSG
jgi:hypothetical protein